MLYFRTNTVRRVRAKVNREELFVAKYVLETIVKQRRIFINHPAIV